MTPNKIIALAMLIVLVLYGIYAALYAFFDYMNRKSDEQIARSERKHATDERNIDYDIEYYFG